MGRMRNKLKEQRASHIFFVIRDDFLKHDVLVQTSDTTWQVWCSVLLCGAVCCSVLQCVAVCSILLQGVAGCCRVLQGVAGCCSVLQAVAGCCRLLQGVAGCCRVLQSASSDLRKNVAGMQRP